jgi:hypothetical protein
MDSDGVGRIARSGDVRAQLAWGEQFEREGNHLWARSLFANAAKTGAQGALRMLAVNLMLYTPQQHADGIRLLRAAGDQGDAEALHLCATMSARDENLPDRHTVMLDFLRRAAAMGHMQAQMQLLLLAQAPENASSVSDWDAVCAHVDIGLWTTIPHRKVLSVKPYIEIFENFIRPEVCDWFIENARPRLARATVYDAAIGTGTLTSDMRTNTTAGISFLDSNAIFSITQSKIVDATNAQSFRLENPSVLHYDVGEQFALHFDFLNPLGPFAADIAKNGQRIATFLIYLNNGFENGETDFPRAHIRYRGNKGDAILFRNVDAEGAPDWDSLHAGLAPTSGEKWLLSQWVRQLPKPH